MLGWLFPRPPVRVQEKAWIEYRFAWLVQQLGERRMLDAPVIEPTDEFFPDIYHGNASDAELMYRRVCNFMLVNPAEMRFEVVSPDDMPSAGGLYDRTDPNNKPLLRIAGDKIADPEALVATLAHEIAHHILLGGGLMTGEEEDHELTTDLLPCVLGLGIFAANSTIRTSAGSSGTLHWWQFQRNGYMPSQGIGYALAVFAWLRDEHSPKWKHHLRLDAREPLVKGLRYLRRTGDCYLVHERLGAMRMPTGSELTERLTHGTVSARVQALWDTQKYADKHSHGQVVKQLFGHPDATVRSTAIQTAAALKLDDPDAIREMDSALGDAEYVVRAAAAQSLGQLQPREAKVVTDLSFALLDDVPEVANAAALALKSYGERAAPAEKNLLIALHNALIDCDYSMVDLLIEVIRSALPDAGQSINNYFLERDLEFRQAAIDALYSDPTGEPS